ncbi:PspC domain-containing protein [Nocardia sp. XZ_19_385]|uniref:PspC domain-containing protein n=1 Tax=Nocardia sp. XZ_19_385 TaxID=2769488 RepID=UPI00188F11D6|nr:PspC domain-containing protein [Nocardia sp. XZ_19_385]
MDGMTKSSFGDQLRQMWQTRPVRLPRQGPVAGVAAGFGQRYNIDPVLVRVAFVVSTMFGGAGIVLYLLGWLLLSSPGGESSRAEGLFGKGQSSQSHTKTIVLIVALCIAVSSMGPFSSGLAGSGVISLALMLAGWWMLHMRVPNPPPGTSELDSDFDFGTGGGLTATGYPGAAFPTTGNYYADVMPVYSPYTKLPDAYVPDRPVEKAMPATDDEPTTLLETSAPAESPARVDVSKSDSGSPANESAAGTPPSLIKQRETSESDSGTAQFLPTRTANAEHPNVFGVTPPSWDPLGVAPLAWDLPDPAPARTVVAPPQKRPRSRLTPTVLGLAILAAGGAGAAAVSGVEWMTPARIAAIALAVIGVGLVIGAFMRRGAGLLVVTAPLAGFVLLASMVGPIDFNEATMGDHTWTPASVSDLRPEYVLSMGAGTLDLRSLNLTESRTVDVSVQMGEAKVLLPQNMTVDTKCTVSIGEVLSCPTGVTGPNNPNAPVLHLNVDVRMGEVEVTRG